MSWQVLEKKKFYYQVRLLWLYFVESFSEIIWLDYLVDYLVGYLVDYLVGLFGSIFCGLFVDIWWDYLVRLFGSVIWDI